MEGKGGAGMKLKEGPEDGGWDGQNSGSPNLSMSSPPQPESLSGDVAKWTLQMWLNQGSGGGALSLEYAGGLKLITRVLKRAREGVIMEERGGCYTGGSEGGGRGWEPRGVGGLQKLEKATNQILLWPLQEECSPADALVLA